VGITSIPLYRLDEDENPVSLASACWLRFLGRSLLLSVSHATREGQWAAELQFDVGKDKTLIHKFGEQWTAQHLDPSSAMTEDLDFSFTEAPDDFYSIFQERNLTGTIVRETARHEFHSGLDDVPTSDEIYAFSGRIHPAHLTGDIYVSNPTVYPGLKYIRTDGYYHVFQLPVEHPGHDAFRGCSGAPIVDRERRIVGLVCSGCTQTNTVTGIAVHKLATGIREYAEE
jgi:hypothetical protein